MQNSFFTYVTRNLEMYREWYVPFIRMGDPPAKMMVLSNVVRIYGRFVLGVDPEFLACLLPAA